LSRSVQALSIKASGCFNACGQHHIADIGLLGVSRNVNGRRVPHFQVVLGGQTTENAAAYGLAIGAVPSRRIPEAVSRITRRFVDERQADESFQAFIKRIGRAAFRDLLADLNEIGDDPTLYTDWGDPRQYSIGDMGVGECAGEVVSLVEFGLADSEREVFEAQLHLEAGDADRAAARAYSAMLQAAKALVRSQNVEVDGDGDRVVALFRERLHETKLFHDPFAGDKFAQYLFRAHAEAAGEGKAAAGGGATAEVAHQRILEAQLFIDAAHAFHGRLG
jgi:sulfite reductase (ferredoxin)